MGIPEWIAFNEVTLRDQYGWEDFRLHAEYLPCGDLILTLEEPEGQRTVTIPRTDLLKCGSVGDTMERVRQALQELKDQEAPKKPKHPLPKEIVELDRLFTYQPPTPEKQEKYDALRHMADDVLIENIRRMGDALGTFDAVNSACKAFALLVLTLCPPCADRNAAIRKVRLARMMLNEHLAVKNRMGEFSTEQEYDFSEGGARVAVQHEADLVRAAQTQQEAYRAILEARMWACAAIALEG